MIAAVVYLRKLNRAVFTALFLFVICALVFPGGKAQNKESEYRDGTYEYEEPDPPESTVIAEPVIMAESAMTESGEAALPEPPPPSRAEQVMKALAAAYPDRIGEAVTRDGDWAVPVMGEWFYYAQGRLLPEALKDGALDYDAQPFYSYAPELPPWQDPTPEEADARRNAADRRREHPAKRSQHFYDALLRAHNQDEAYERVKTIKFLNRNVLVHYTILEELSLVEARILQDAQTDAQVRDWIRAIDTLSGWNWRIIADTQSRSFHAYGTAVDILPTSRRGFETYWLWTAEYNREWWAVPYSKRVHPPDKVIKAFEAYGFVWGGKWLFYDTMHFEYRPEIFILNGLPLTFY
jgi:hypothetical protein